jgi:integrase
LKEHSLFLRGQYRAGKLSCLRHTAVSLLKDAGISASVVMELVGHDSEQMSAHYTHTGLEALGVAMHAMPTITGATQATKTKRATK